MTTKRFLAASLLTICIVLLASGARADQFSAAWLANNLGIWEQDGVWSTSAYPNNGHTIPGANGQPVPGPNPTYDVLISIPAPCTLNRYVRVQTVNVLNGSTLNLGSNGYLWANTGFGNAGLITLNSSGNFTGLLRGAANSNVVAGGEIFMSDHASNSVTSASPSKVLTIFAGGRIRGGGAVNQYHGDDIRTYFQIVNHGLIEALHPVNALNVQLTDEESVTQAVVNDGTVRASGSGVLRISSPFGRPVDGNFINHGGTIAAIDNGTVRLERRVTLTGGTLATSGNGTIRGDYPNGSGGTFKDVLNTGTMVIGQNENFGLAGTFTNNALVLVEGPANLNTGLFIRGANTLLAGSGLIALNGSGIAGGDYPGQTLTIGGGQTIRGSGQIGTNNSNFSYKILNVVNQGLIDATGPLTMITNTSENSEITNNGGTLRASNGGQLNLSASGVGRVLNSGGRVEALAESVVRVNNLVTLEGGTVTTSGSGTIRGGVSGAGGTLKNVTNNGSVAIGVTETLGLAGTFINNGSVSIDGSAQQNNTVLRVRDDVTLSGSGLVTMSGGYFGAVIATESFTGKILTVGSGVTIRGDGRVELKLVNQGTIEATNYMFFGLNTFLQTGSFNNGGILRAGSGSSIEVNGNTGGVGPVTFSNGGVIEARSGSTIQFTGATMPTNYNAATQTLTGGTYFANGGTLNLNIGSVVTNAATVILSGTTAQFSPINSMTQNNGMFVLNNGATRTFAGAAGAAARGDQPSATFPNAGTMIIGNNSRLNINGDFAQGSNGKLEVVISSDTQPAALNVSGTAALAGQLEVKLAAGYTPPAGATFPILSAANVTGGFVQVTGATVSYGPNGVSVQPTGNTNALQMTNAVSRKVHGSAGTFDVPLPGVECRSSNGNHTVVFTFSNAIASGTASITGGTAAMTESAAIDGNTVTVNLTNVADVQQVQVQLAGITDVYSQALPDTAVPVRFLVGDTNGNGSVTATDIGQTKASAGAFLTPANFRSDVTPNGAITASDIGLVKSRSGATIP